MVHPSLAEFLASAEPRLTSPIWMDLLADFETPLSAYWKLAHDEPVAFLLESVTGGEQLARYSVLGVRPRAILRTKNQDQSPFDQVRTMIRPGKGAEGLPKFFGGLVGFIGYDAVRFLEDLPDQPPDDLDADDVHMLDCHCVVVFDHAKNLVKIIYNATPTSDGYQQGVDEIERIAARLRGPLPQLPSASGGRPSASRTPDSNTKRETFEANVERVRQYIAEGDGIQMVLSQRFSVATEADPLNIYRALRSLNPSPYMFLLKLDNCDIVGASPEILVSLTGRTARVRPIAGTRWRGKTQAEDESLAEELLKDEKERAEHIMLVDLGRNDLGRVCETGSIKVGELMVVERYSHVMHIVSDVSGTLAPGQDTIDLIEATFPAGTVSGAPKVRAMQIIDELEPTARGLYAGAVGYIGNTGDTDLCIAIRTIFIKDGVAHVQAGAGLVYDSVPSNEFEECGNKARACLAAIEMAESGL